MNHQSHKPLPESLHFIGVGGSGMAPLAGYAISLGHKVSGSDQQMTPYTRDLEKLGVRIFHGHHTANLPDGALVIISSAIPADNPELHKARKDGLTVQHRSELLANFVHRKSPLVVSGTHGKTTTTAMLGWLLMTMKDDPDLIVGASLNHSHKAFNKGKGPRFVVEADESDSSFLRFRPDLAVITNIDKDHLDHYGDEAGVEKAFRQFALQTKATGTVIVGTDQEKARKLFDSLPVSQRLSFGLSGHCDLRATDLRYEGEFTGFLLHAPDLSSPLPVRLRATGSHNVLNALGALAALKSLGFSLKVACGHLAHFPGVARRLSLLYRNSQISLLDDYAHNPGKITACINSVRLAWPSSHLVVIFQPHRFSRLQTMFDDFTRSFSSADEVYCCPVFAAGEPHDPAFTPERIARGIAEASRTKVRVWHGPGEYLKVLAKTPPENTVILTVGAGDITRTAHNLAGELEKHFGTPE